MYSCRTNTQKNKKLKTKCILSPSSLHKKLFFSHMNSGIFPFTLRLFVPNCDVMQYFMSRSAVGMSDLV
jgi:hypothetical protein